MIFQDLGFVLLWIVLVPLILFFYLKWTQRGQVLYSSLRIAKSLKPSLSLRLRHLLIIIRVLAITSLIIALMRPQKGIEEAKIEKEGIDIMLVVDVSGSMLAEDFVVQGKRVNRLEAVKNVVRDFIQKRKDDRIGLIVFAGSAYMQCPYTLDYGVLLEFLDRIDVGMIEDGTAIGDGVASALARLRKLDSKSKVIILLTDGVNNTGIVDPQTASELAKTLDIKVYTIGTGSKGRVPFPAKDFFGNKVYQWAVIDLDEKLLKQMASLTGAKYFRATDTEELREIYEEINRLEKTKVEIDAYTDYQELYIPFVLMTMLLILLETVLRHTRLRTIP